MDTSNSSCSRSGNSGYQLGLPLLGYFENTTRSNCGVVPVSLVLALFSRARAQWPWSYTVQRGLFYILHSTLTAHIYSTLLFTHSSARNCSFSCAPVLEQLKHLLRSNALELRLRLPDGLLAVQQQPVALLLERHLRPQRALRLHVRVRVTYLEHTSTYCILVCTRIITRRRPYGYGTLGYIGVTLPVKLPVCTRRRS